MTAKSKPLNVIVVGAGAVGLVYAHHLRTAGCQVHLMVKPEYVESVSSRPTPIHQVSLFPPARISSKPSRRSQAAKTLVVPTTVLQTGAVPDGYARPVDRGGLGGEIDWVIITVPSNVLRGPWLADLTASLPNARYCLLQISPADAPYLVSCGIPADRTYRIVVALASFFAPMENDRFPLVDADTTAPAKPKPQQPTDSPSSSSTLRKRRPPAPTVPQLASSTPPSPHPHPLVYFNFSPHPMLPHPISPYASAAAESVAAADTLAAAFSRGGLPVIRAGTWGQAGGTRPGGAAATVGFGPFLVALEAARWSFLALALSPSLLLLFWRAAFEILYGEIRRSGLGILPVITSIAVLAVTCPPVMTVALLAGWAVNASGLVLPLDFEAFLGTHFGKVGPQTKMAVDDMVERYKADGTQVWGLEGLRKANWRWSGKGGK